VLTPVQIAVKSISHTRCQLDPNTEQKQKKKGIEHKEHQEEQK
jgi:hypothetical protein